MPGSMQQRADERRVKKAEREVRQIQRDIKSLEDEKRKKIKLIREKYTFRAGAKNKASPSQPAKVSAPPVAPKKPVSKPQAFGAAKKRSSVDTVSE